MKIPTLLCVLMFVLWSHIIASDAIAGYSLQSTPQGIEIYAFTQNGMSTEPVTTLTDFTIEGEYPTQWDILDKYAISLSPDGQTFVFLASQNAVDATLFLLDLSSLSLTQTEVEMNSIQPLSTFIWSPDSTRFYLDPSTQTPSFPIIYDLAQEEIIYTFDDDAFSVRWMPDGQNMIYHQGRNIYHLNIPISTDTIIATVTLENLGVEREPTPPLGLEYMAFSPERIFFVYREGISLLAPQENVWLGSIDFTGAMRLEVDLNDLFTDEVQIRISPLFYESTSSTVFAVAHVQTNGESPFRNVIIRLDSNQRLDIIYQRHFPSSDDIQFITSFRVSPDGRYLALGASNPDQSNGNVTVIDLTTGREVWNNDTQTAVCSLYWTANDRVLYGQSETVRCPFKRPNLPSETLIEHHLTNNSTITVFDGQNDHQYFFSLYPETPGHY